LLTQRGRAASRKAPQGEAQQQALYDALM
jgi:hypothetical protein